jgi:hypothetical protein
MQNIEITNNKMKIEYHNFINEDQKYEKQYVIQNDYKKIETRIFIQSHGKMPDNYTIAIWTIKPKHKK